MVRCLQVSLALAGSIFGADGARMVRKHGAEKQSPTDTKFVAGVPILNYHLAYGGGPSLTELGEAVEEKWIVMMKDKASKKDIQAFCAGRACKLSGNPEEGGVPFVELQGTEKDLEVALSSSKGLAQFVEPDLMDYAIPDFDAQASASWGLDRVGASSAGTTGKGVTAYVLDTGIRSTHTDFGGRSASALDMTSGSRVECNGAQNCGGDKQGHGSHCAGTVGGSTYGVAPGASIRAVKVLGDDGRGSTSWGLSALDWVATKGARPALCSMSLGSATVKPSYKTAVDDAVNAGVTVVVAGGNSNSDACGFSPAYVPSAITVGSIDSTDTRSYFSNYGECTDIWAPGSAITSASHTSDTGSRALSGTSMACPHVSGAVALLLESHPSWNSEQVLQSMTSTSVKGAISDLRTTDVNNLLCVGTCDPGSPAPPPVEVLQCPSFASSRTPDRDGDCACPYGQICSTSGSGGPANCPSSGGLGAWGGKYFLPTCSDCMCFGS